MYISVYDSPNLPMYILAQLQPSLFSLHTPTPHPLPFDVHLLMEQRSEYGIGYAVLGLRRMIFLLFNEARYFDCNCKFVLYFAIGSIAA